MKNDGIDDIPSFFIQNSIKKNEKQLIKLMKGVKSIRKAYEWW